MASDAHTFSLWLKDRRKTLDLTQEDLAERVGCSIWTIRKIETGERKPSRQVVELLAEALRVPDGERALFTQLARSSSQAPQPQPAPLYTEGSLPQPPNSNNLPALPTPLIGRDKEMEAVRARLLSDGVGLLTLTGPPGIGKTRLALEMGWRLLPEFNDGVYFVPLASISDPYLVAFAMAGVFGLKEVQEQPMQTTLEEYLRDKSALLVLDNFEQVISAANLVADLLLRCPHMKVLVTSREALHLRMERQFNVPPLTLPNADRLPSAATLLSYEAVHLFVERAQAGSNFRLVEGNAEAVAAICARLDGLPLAIELVAARSRLLSPQAMLTRLKGSEGKSHSSLQLAAGGARDLPPRHQTLRNAIEWSYNLLEEGEQKLFARLGVFVGGSTVASAEAVCNARGDLQVDVLEGVESLIDKSLLREGRTFSQDGPAEEGVDYDPRFAMLETLRAYALERLEEFGEREVLSQWHAEYYLALAEAAEPMMRGPEQVAWLNRLEAELGNLRAVLEWSQAPEGNAEVGLRIAGALHYFWWWRGYLSEGREWLVRALPRPEVASPSAARAKALNATGSIAFFQGDYEGARLFYEECLQIRRERGDRQGVAGALGNLGLVAWSLNDHKAALTLHEESLLVLRELGDKHGVARALIGLGATVCSQGDYGQAEAMYKEALGLFQELGDKQSSAGTYNNLGEVAVAQGDYKGAKTYYSRSMVLFQETGNKGGVAGCLDGLAQVSKAQGQPERAARLLGAAEAINTAIGEVLPAANRADYDSSVAGIRDRLGEEAFALAWAEGRAMSLEQAIAFAFNGK